MSDAWPKRGDKPFISYEDGARFSISSLPHDDRYYNRARSFRKAADIVLEKCMEDGDEPANDTLFFPVLYTYRHCIELSLKSLVIVGIERDFFQEEDVEKHLKKHDLAKLWNKAKQLLMDAWPNADPTPLKATETVINKLHQFDSDGQASRYPCNTDGKPYNYKELPDNIRLSNLKKAMDRVCNFLETTWSVLEDDLQNRREMMRQYRN